MEVAACCKMLSFENLVISSAISVSRIRDSAMQDVRFPKSEEKKSLWRRLVEWAFPNFKINKKEYTVDSSRYVRYQDVTEPEKILQPDDFD